MFKFYKTFRLTLLKDLRQTLNNKHIKKHLKSNKVVSSQFFSIQVEPSFQQLCDTKQIPDSFPRFFRKSFQKIFDY